MKKLFAILLFTIALVGIGNAQTTGKEIGSFGRIYTDSLGYSDSDPSNVADSTMVLDLAFNYDWLRVFIKGNANSAVDSIGVRFGTVRYNNAKTAVDTLWGSYFSTMKDSADNDCARIINNTVGKDYFFLTPRVQLVRFDLMNHRVSLLTRNTVITVQAINDLGNKGGK